MTADDLRYGMSPAALDRTLVRMPVKIPALTWAVAQAATQLVHQDTPLSHDELGRLFTGAGFGGVDPGPEGGGKAKRMRAVMEDAMAHKRVGGARLVYRLIDSIRGRGGFRQGDPAYIGQSVYLNPDPPRR